MTDRILCSLTVSLLIGVLYGRYQYLWLIAALLLLMGIVTAVMVHRYSRFSKKGVCKAAAIRCLLCLLLFLAGNWHCRLQQEQYAMGENLVIKNPSHMVEGEIEKKQEKETQSIYILKNTKATVDGRKYPGGKILVYTSNNTYQPGNKIEVTGDCELFRIPRNEGNFNEKQYYQSKKITYKIISTQEKLLSSKQNRYAVQLEQLRQKLKEVLIFSLPQKEAGVLVNMVLGEKSLLEPEIKTLYQQAGISHVLAISGLHVSLFGMGAFGVLRKIHCPKKMCACIAAFVVYSFGILSGMEISTLRAVIMFLMAMAAQITGYTYDSVTGLAVSGAIQLWENPYILDNAGFLFSYSAVLGVTVVADIIRKQKQHQMEIQKGHTTKQKVQKEKRDKKLGRIQKTWKGISDTLFVSFCIQLTTLPLSLYFYYEMPCYSVLTNGCILPFMGPLLFLGMTGGLIGLFSRKMAALVLIPAKWILKGNEFVCNSFLSLPGAILITGKPEPGLLVFYYILLALGLYLIQLKGSKKPLLGILAALLLVIAVRTKNGFEIDVLDVGQGDGIYIESKQGQSFFIDGGSSDVKQAGTYRILPFLKFKGAKKIKGWVVSHGDADHISGLMEILESGYQIEYLILADGMIRDEAFDTLTEKAKQAGSQIRFIKSGEKLEADGITFTALWPEEKDAGQSDRNGASLVLSVEYQSFTGLFTGDIGKEQEAALIERGYLEKLDLQGITLYKAAHHGSDYSNSLAFLEALSPEAVVVSCGERNQYGHPGKAAVSRMEQAGSQIYYTMKSGQITIRWENNKGFIREFQN